MNAKILLDKETITAASNKVTEIIDLDLDTIEGFFSVQLIVTGGGTAKIEYMNSNLATSLDTDYVVQSAAADIIVSNFTATSGPGSDGKDVISFSPEPANRMKLKVTETGGVTAIAVTLIICVG